MNKTENWTIDTSALVYQVSGLGQASPNTSFDSALSAMGVLFVVYGAYSGVKLNLIRGTVFGALGAALLFKPWRSV